MTPLGDPPIVEASNDTKVDNMNGLPKISDYGIENPSQLLRKMIAEDSPLEVEWLWAADRVLGLAERRYSLARAIYINPENEKTWRLLQAIEPVNAPPSSIFERINVLFAQRRSIGLKVSQISAPKIALTPRIGR
jgi:hypothetical protein